MQNLFMNDTALKLVPSQMPVSEDEVRLAQQNWAKAIVDIGQVYVEVGDVAEDNGFALRPWSRVDFGRQQIVVMDGGAFAMGEYFLTPQNTTDGDLRVEFRASSINSEPFERRNFLAGQGASGDAVQALLAGGNAGPDGKEQVQAES